mgnify:CR=1 FL=1
MASEPSPSRTSCLALRRRSRDDRDDDRRRIARSPCRRARPRRRRRARSGRTGSAPTRDRSSSRPCAPGARRSRRQRHQDVHDGAPHLVGGPPPTASRKQRVARRSRGRRRRTRHRRPSGPGSRSDSDAQAARLDRSDVTLEAIALDELVVARHGSACPCVTRRCVGVTPSRSTASMSGSSGAPLSRRQQSHRARPPGGKAFESHPECMLRSTIIRRAPRTGPACRRAPSSVTPSSPGTKLALSGPGRPARSVPWPSSRRVIARHGCRRASTTK